jgi:DNA-binding NarL/FixJ family response regulator
MINIAILDDKKDYLDGFSDFFDGPDFKCVFTAISLESLWFELETKAENLRFLFVDIYLDNESGLEAVSKIHRRYPHLELVMHSSVEDSEALIKSFASGASGYLLKTHDFLQIKDYLDVAMAGGAAVSPTMARKLVAYFKPREFERGKLGARTLQVLHFLAEGWSYKLIADNMGISIDGVRFHIKEIYRTLNVQSKPQAVRKYLDGDY